jgi:hypothetical protein
VSFFVFVLFANVENVGSVADCVGKIVDGYFGGHGHSFGWLFLKFILPV